MLVRLRRKLLYSRVFRKFVKWAKGVQPPGFEGFSLYEVSRFFLEALQEGDLITRASAISFRVFMAFFPALIVLLTLIPFVPIADFQERLLTAIYDMLPLDVYRFIESTLHDLVVRKHHTLLSISFVLGLFFASNSVNAILLGFAGSKNLSRWHSAFKQRVLSIWVLLALSIVMMMVIPIVTFSGFIIQKLEAIGFFGNFIQVALVFFIKWTLSLLLIILCVALLFNAGEMRGRRFRVFTPGSILSVLLILAASEALAFAFTHITDYNALYGSIGAILAVQLWIYINMIVLLVGFELNTSISRAHRLRTEKLEQVNKPAGARASS